MEVLAPAGNKENLISAINGGANAVYLGLTDFSARKSADNFTLEDLKYYLAYAKTFNVKVYLTVNTLIKNSELNSFVDTIIKAYNLGVDAFILQDVFLGKYLKKLIPNICLHLSTQAGVCNVYGAKLAKEYGFSRVILARETKLDDIKQIANIIETEVFVQGALCTSLSGHCYFSSFIGGNSGNRGYCKQPCRKKYSYYNNKGEKLTDGYSLSLADLNLSSKLSTLIEIGVKSLKIEGRMRSKEYVYFASKYYSNLLNGINDKNLEISLYKTYNRGDYTLGLGFNQDKNFISNDIQGHKGYFLSKISKIYSDELLLESKIPLTEGDSYKILSNNKEVGNAICVKKNDKLVIIYKGDVKIGDSLYITKDLSLSNLITDKKLDVNVSVYLKVGEKLKLTANAIEVFSENPIDIAKSHPITKEELTKNLQKTDIYPFNPIITFENFDENAFIVKSQLNNLRAELYSKLFYRKNNIICDNTTSFYDFSILKFNKFNRENSIIISTIANISNDINNVIYSPCDYSEINLIDEFISYYKNKKVWLYIPPFFSGEDLKIIDNYVSKFYGVFIEGYWGLEYAKTKDLKVFIGTGLNIFNKVDINLLSEYTSVEQLTLSKELSSNEINDFTYDFTLLNNSEVQIMDLIYCPFNKDCKNCKYTDNSYLQDEDKRTFPVFRYKTNECRFKIYNVASLYSEKLIKYNQLYDLTTKNSEFIEDFTNKNTHQEKSQSFKNLTVGNYRKGIKW